MEEALKLFSRALLGISDRDLSEALELIQKYTATRPYLMYTEDVDRISESYRLMLQYYENGSPDPMRKAMYNDMLAKLEKIVRNLRIDYKRRNTPFFKETYNKAVKSGQLSVRGIQMKLEGFVGDLAMLQFEPVDERDDKEKKVYSEHYSFLESLFCDIVTSDLWTDDFADGFLELMLSPTIDASDVQVLLSGLMLAAMNNFDLNKFRVLVGVYEKSVDEKLRQRALVGWVFSMNGKMDLNGQRKCLSALLANEEVAREIVDFQKQVLLCMDADKDYAVIKRDIMPTLIKNSNFEISRLGITEKEEDRLQSILNPDAQDRAMEETEDKFRKMMDMQKSGSDIYFGGFSQMKRFPFFYSLVNWFCPFHVNHPDLVKYTAKLNGNKFMSNLLANGPFCDSDKYSFALAMVNVIDSLPPAVKEMMGNGEVMGATVSAEESNSPAFVRRQTLQDLYRFFRLYTWHDALYNPFSKANYLFVVNPIFRGTAVDKKMEELGAFLKSRHDTGSVRQLVQLTCDGKNVMSDAFCGFYFLDSCMFDSAADCFSSALKSQPSSEMALIGLAKAYFGSNKYAKARDIYQTLYDKYPENKVYGLEYSIVLSCLWETSEALKVLYRLDYTYPDTPNIMRVLAWTLMIDKNADKAEKKYTALLDREKASAEDWLNAGYCSWSLNNIKETVRRFSVYCKMMHNEDGPLTRYEVHECLDEKFLYDEKFLKGFFHMTWLDRQLIMDLVCKSLSVF